MDTFCLIVNTLIEVFYILILVLLPIITVVRFVVWKNDRTKSIFIPFAWSVITLIAFAIPETLVKLVLGFIVIVVLPVAVLFVSIFVFMQIDNIRNTYNGNYKYLFVTEANVNTLYKISQLLCTELIEVYVCSETTIYGDRSTGYYAFRCDNNRFKFIVINSIFEFIPGITKISHTRLDELYTRIERMEHIRSYA